MTPATSSDLIALAERVEKAERPSREMDAEIAAALDLRPNWARDDPRSLIVANRYGIGLLSLGVGGPGITAACYTSSVDSAAQLAPEGWCWSAGDDYYDPTPGWARVFPRVGGQILGTGNRYSATPALALCAAVLRARAAMLQETE